MKAVDRPIFRWEIIKVGILFKKYKLVCKNYFLGRFTHYGCNSYIYYDLKLAEEKLAELNSYEEKRDNEIYG